MKKRFMDVESDKTLAANLNESLKSFEGLVLVGIRLRTWDMINKGFWAK